MNVTANNKRAGPKSTRRLIITVYGESKFFSTFLIFVYKGRIIKKYTVSEVLIY